jgi:hypothetical protein
MWQQENVEKQLPIVFGSKTYIGRRNTTMLSLLSTLILKVK